MSFRIKLPPRGSENDQTDEPVSSRRKPNKRRIVDSDDGEDGEEDTVVASSSNTRSKRARRPSQRVLDAMGSDAEVDVEGDHAIDSRFLAAAAQDIPASTRTAGSTASNHARSSTKSKKRRVVQTSEDDDDDLTEGPVVDEFDNSRQPSYSDEDESIDGDNDLKRSTKGKSATKRKATKVASAMSNGAKKAKAKAAKLPEKEIMMKDERKSAQSSASSIATNESTAGLKRARPKEELDNDILDSTTMGAGSSAAAAANAEESTTTKDAARPPPKKLKLPTIKKHKTTLGSAGPSTPSMTSAPPPKAISAATSKQTIGDSKTMTANTVRPAAYVGMADFDLRNPSVYSELFKTANAGTPRSGLNRREKEEERLKELNKMRDEARAKRMAEAKYSFDLQAQVDKITCFEDVLIANRSSALYPNCLGAKWRDDWELKRRREQAAEESHV